VHKWAAFEYRNTYNLGDEIQTIAALRFTPSPSYRIDRDFLAQFTPPENEEVAIIANGWFGHRPENLSVQPRVTPLMISVHFSNNIGLGTLGLSATDAIRQPAMVDYLNRWGPIGARDMATYKFLQRLGVNTYFSGCLTLTLQRSPEIKQQDYVLCVDVPDECISNIRRRTPREIILQSPGNFRETIPAARFERAGELLKLYQRAHCVVTTRLHCALPCLAYDVPVLLLDTAQDQQRFSGLNNFLRHCDVATFLAHRINFDFEVPEPNAHDYLGLRQELISTIHSFVANPGAFHASRGPSREAHYNTLWSLYRDIRCRNERAAADLVAREAEVSALREEIARNASELRLREGASQAEVSALREEIARNASELKVLREGVSRLTEQLGAITAVHEALLHSTSWRLTAPLRHLMRTSPTLHTILRRVVELGRRAVTLRWPRPRSKRPVALSVMETVFPTELSLPSDRS
jgi:hypothetical protein